MKFLNEKLNSAKYEAIQRAKTTLKYLKEVRNNKLIQAIKEGKPNDMLKQIAINAVVDEIKLAIALKGYEGRIENFDVDLFIFKNFKRSLFSVTSTDLKVIRAAVKSFNNVSRVRLDEFNFISVEYIQVQEVVEPLTKEVAEPVTEKQKEEAIPVEAEPVSSTNKVLPVLYNKIVNNDIEEVEYEEVPNTSKRPSDYIRQQSILIPNTFRWGKLF
ncbi:hypothetical protein [uncultured Bacteroides sp.]|jgi:hypothetical protein|uniref:hypothetical protein n=1 Tax=uncultured Bacteroides sp. TaxID=162156 RepID=UPI0008203E0C|nr:hypothetical protein [uncultured Bacteroides sp.]SCH15959.1 Uncharacterised protein [uncultured Bacteroides sp.]